MFVKQTRNLRQRHNLIRIGNFSLLEKHKIKTVEGLRHHLQTAIELEHSTIPPYLCALYSIVNDKNIESTQIIKSVVMEEMLHLILAANVLNAIGGTPIVDKPNFIPEYPTYLPHSDKSFKVSLSKFSRDTVETFLKIEKPAEPCAEPEPNHYQTIGQFYEAIEIALRELSEQENIFTGDPNRQITPEYYYGGGGEIVPVTDLDSALNALNEIIGQGEGINQTIFDGDHRIFGQEIEYAHYFRFNEIFQGQYYTNLDTPKSGPTGDPLNVDWQAVYNMQQNPKLDNYPKGSELWKKTLEFNKTYTSLLNGIHQALNGRPRLLLASVKGMYELKYQAIELMKTPIDASGITAGPSFEYASNND